MLVSLKFIEEACGDDRIDLWLLISHLGIILAISALDWESLDWLRLLSPISSHYLLHSLPFTLLLLLISVIYAWGDDVAWCSLARRNIQSTRLSVLAH